jgi:hypothetical protein
MVTVGRLILLAVFAAVSAVAAGADPAGGKEQYAVSVTAVQDGNYVQVEVKVSHVKPDGRTDLLSTPKLLIIDGSRATCSVGQTRTETRPAGKWDVPLLWEGIQIDVIKPVGKDEAICVTTVFSRELIVYALAENVKVTRGRIEAPRPASAPATGPGERIERIPTGILPPKKD